MTLDEIAAEVQDRGFHHIPSGRIKRWVNKHYRRVNTREAWPFLETTATGSAPLSISDLRAVLSVTDTDNENPLAFEDLRTIREADPELEEGGNPIVWYQNPTTQINTYPTSTVSLNVLYLKRTSALDDSDSPAWPDEYHLILVEGGVWDAYRQTDNFEAASAVKEDFEEGVAEMAADLLVPNYDTPREILIEAGGSVDW